MHTVIYQISLVWIIEAHPMTMKLSGVSVPYIFLLLVNESVIFVVLSITNQTPLTTAGQLDSNQY